MSQQLALPPVICVYGLVRSSTPHSRSPVPHLSLWPSAPLSVQHVLSSVCLSKPSAPSGPGLGSSFPSFWSSAQQLLNKKVEKVSLKKGFLQEPPHKPQSDLENKTRTRASLSLSLKDWLQVSMWCPGSWMEVSLAICQKPKDKLIFLKGVRAGSYSHWDLLGVVIFTCNSELSYHNNTANPHYSHLTFVEATHFYADCITGKASTCSGSMARPWSQSAAGQEKWKEVLSSSMHVCLQRENKDPKKPLDAKASVML